MSIRTNNGGMTVVELEKHRLEEYIYSLYSLSKSKTEKYVIVIDSEEDADIQMIGGTEEQATALFRRVYENKASCHHLSDIADDYRKEIERQYDKNLI